jgi:3-dehydroquinate synthase
MKKIDINIPGKNYPVFMGAGIFKELELLIADKSVYKNLFLFIDKNVFDLHKKQITFFVKKYPYKKHIHIYSASEKNKNFSAIMRIHSELIENNFGRDTTLIAIGGGITGDVGGFAASTYSRGIDFVQIPTTLLSAVDSSVGGKTGINFGDTKNIIGTFYQPAFVLIDFDFLRTLNRSDIICGAGEILKYGLLTDISFIAELKKNIEKLISLDEKFIRKVLELCIRFKGDVVSEDEKEAGLRKVLNLGHTFAHAIEVEQNHKIKHGQAVAIGLICALELSHGVGLMDEYDKEELVQLPLVIKNEISIKKYSAEKIYDIMKRDKKGRDQKIKFVLPAFPGKVILDVEADKKDVINSIKKSFVHFNVKR